MKVSECCGAEGNVSCDISFEDVGICPTCREHCVFVEDEEPKKQPSELFKMVADINMAIIKGRRGML